MIEYLKGATVNSEFYEQEFQNANEHVFRVEKVSKRKKNMLVEWKEYDDSYRRWFNKKMLLHFVSI